MVELGMRLLKTLSLVAMLIPQAVAEPVAEPGSQCPRLISQVESRLKASPPQNEESVEQARNLLRQAIEAEQEGDYRTCMSKIRQAFKFLNKT